MIFVASVCHEFYSGIEKWVYVIIMCVIQFLLCQIRHIRQLQYTSAMGNVLVASIVVAIYGYNLNKLGETGNKATKAWDTDIRHFPRTIGIFIFALEGITVVL